jgi:septal ring factor EnvC (AmiA/AmiB activator)
VTDDEEADNERNDIKDTTKEKRRRVEAIKKALQTLRARQRSLSGLSIGGIVANDRPDNVDIVDKIKEMQHHIDWFKRNYKYLNDWQQEAIKSFTKQLAKLQMEEI